MADPSFTNVSDAVKQHKRFYDDDDKDNDADDRSLGSAAAMQALKLFSGGQSGSSAESNSQSAFVGLAMAEASKVRGFSFFRSYNLISVYIYLYIYIPPEHPSARNTLANC